MPDLTEAKVFSIVDDIIVFGIDRTTHDKTLNQLIIKCREMDIKLNPDKIEIGKTQIISRFEIGFQ